MSPSINEQKSREDRREIKRQCIMEVASRLFAEQGFSGCEMERVASEFGIAKGTLYLYFSGKEELFLACVDWGMDCMQRAVRASYQQDDEPFTRISNAIKAYLTFFDENPHYVELLVQERAIFKNRQRPAYFEYRDANRGPWVKLYAELIEQGVFRNDLPLERMLDAIGNLLYGTMFTNYFVGRKASIEEQHASILEIFFHGIVTSKS